MAKLFTNKKHIYTQKDKHLTKNKEEEGKVKIEETEKRGKKK